MTLNPALSQVCFIAYIALVNPCEVALGVSISSHCKFGFVNIPRLLLQVVLQAAHAREQYFSLLHISYADNLAGTPSHRPVVRTQYILWL